MSFHIPPRGARCRARLASGRAFAPLELARQLAWTRREFIRSAAGVALGGFLPPSSLIARAGIPARKRKVVVITFGGGARDQETFAPEGQETHPHLILEFNPHAT